MKNYIRLIISGLLLAFVLLIPILGFAQNASSGTIIQGNVISSFDKSPLIGVNVSEVDINNRVVSASITDVNGHYVLRVKSMQNKLSFSYVSYVKTQRKINNQQVVNVSMEEQSSQNLKNVEVVAKKKMGQGGYVIPTREIGTAMQTINTKEFEGLQVASIDDALQGRIAGLDIVATSGDPGSGSSMRIRGVTSINGNSQPLIVVNGVPFEMQVDPNFDFANSNQEQYANMLSINPDDILEITVLKDAAASAIWGSKGANGVLMITTKKGISGPTRVEYTYRTTATKQPRGMNMLNGGEFKSLMKEAYLNPRQDTKASDIPAYNADKNYVEYENFNNNTDWISEVSQIGSVKDHYLTLSGGGERANYRVSLGLYNQTGTIIGQKLDRVSSRAYMEYTVSNRIKFISEFSLTNTDNYRSYQDDDENKRSILGIAYAKMPNVGVYAQDSKGNNTGTYYNISRYENLDADQRDLKNPVALARLATNKLSSFRILPTFRLQYDLIDPDKQMLRFNSYVSFDINNNKTSMFLPQEVSNTYWSNQYVNRAYNADNENISIYADNNLMWQPKFTNPDHSFTLYGSFQLTVGNSAKQDMLSFSLPSGQAIDASNFAYLGDAATGHSSWRSLAFMVRSHYAYKGRYIVDGTFRRDGSTKFGAGNKFGDFPGISFRWNVSDEKFMKPLKWISMMAPRFAYGISGNQPDAEYLHFSRYSNFGSYAGMSAVKPNSLRLNNLKWETTSSFNYGLQLGFLDDTYVFDFDFYNKTTKDLLFKKIAISTSSGFGTLPYINGGTMDNDGWEVNVYANRFIKTKNFSVDFRFNLSNSKNTLVKLDEALLNSYNKDFEYNNGEYLTRVQEGNSFGSIYGFRYKGVYQYDKYTAEHTNAPVARNAKGEVITDEHGNPRSMYFAYGNEDKQYKFRGGDAIYEDINHDGSIDKLDIVYLGNSNPKLNGGFGPTFRYKNFSCNMFFNFRLGNKIVNMARMWSENMYNDNNQSQAVNWRWRKDGDLTDMPRALHEFGYNWLASDRYVEDGSFLRFKYITFNYSVPSNYLKKYSVNKLSFYLTINNLLVLTKYTGVDPEVGYGDLGLSKDESSTPRSRDLTLGVSLGF